MQTDNNKPKNYTTMKKLFTLLTLALAFTAISASAATISTQEETQTEDLTKVVFTDRVSSDSSNYYYITCLGGESVRVVADGDGDTDLDLYIYDENGNTIDSDTDNTDYCICSWTPKWTGQFTIKVRNYGSVYNEFTLTIE